LSFSSFSSFSSFFPYGEQLQLLRYDVEEYFLKAEHIQVALDFAPGQEKHAQEDFLVLEVLHIDLLHRLGQIVAQQKSHHLLPLPHPQPQCAPSFP
jgi:hypothetical protein